MSELFSSFTFDFFLIIRFLIPFGIFISPKVTIIASLLIDGADGDFFETFLNLDRRTYQTYDKILDSWWLLLILVFIILKNLPYRNIFIALFIYRIIGVVIMSFWFQEYLLMVFPNVFEVLFEAYIFFPNWVNSSWKNLKAPYPALFFITLLVFAREYWLHVLKMDVIKMKAWWERFR